MLARLEYASWGWWTFPAPADELKKSLKWACKETDYVKWGATLDPEVIRAEFNGGFFNSSLRNQNIGIMCGIKSGIFVIDTDTAEHGEGIDGAAVLKAKEKKHGKLPKTLMARSPSGSLHRFFKHPGPGIKVKSSNGIFGDDSGVDAKGDGGMVLAAPSYRPAKPATANKPAKTGGYYQWVNAGHAIADAPKWLLDVVIEVPKPPGDPHMLHSGARRQGNRRLVQAALNQFSSNCHYEDWIQVAAALRSEFGEDGEDLFHYWSAKSPQYSEHECSTKWVQTASLAGHYSVGTIFYFAEKANPGWRAESAIDAASENACTHR